MSTKWPKKITTLSRYNYKLPVRADQGTTASRKWADTQNGKNP